MPTEVVTKVEQHRAAGPVEEHMVRWRRDWWERADLPLLRDAVDRVAALSETDDGGWLWVARRAVMSLAPGDDDGDSWALFAGTMIWGYGPVGYGAERTSRILWSTRREKVEANLDSLVAAARQGPAEAWDAITNTHRTHRFATAFATKFAYFAAWSPKAPAGHSTRPRPLIADKNTSRAVWDLCRIPRSAYRRVGYLRYVDLVHDWAGRGGWRADEVERALFEIGKTVPRSQSAADGVLTARRGRPADRRDRGDISGLS